MLPLALTLHAHTPAANLMFSTRRSDYRTSVLNALGPNLAASALWTGSTVPTLANASELLPSILQPHCPLWERALRDTSSGSPLDAADGNYEPVVLQLASRIPTTVSAMSLAFSTNIAPLGTSRGTRTKAWRNWRSCLTWAVARQACHQLLPMPPTALQAMLWDFASMGATNSTLKSIVDAVISRHRDAHLTPPVSGPGAYLRLTRCLGRVMGTQRPHRFGVTRDMVVALLRTPPSDALAFRNNLVTCTLTVGCMRPGEGADAQSCDLHFNADFLRGFPQFEGGSTLCTRKRKQDQERKGHWMRFGKSADPALDLNHQLGLLMDLLGTRPRTGCTKLARPGARCPVCPPLFPKLARAADGSWSVHPRPTPSSAAVSAMVVAALESLGVDTTSFSGASCRMGGLTTAIEAGVPEHVLWMQSGHAQDRAARRYVRLTNPDRLYDTWRSFRL